MFHLLHRQKIIRAFRVPINLGALDLPDLGGVELGILLFVQPVEERLQDPDVVMDSIL